ncbi:Methyltransferase type 11 [Mesorhizobium plurifarium]|uniref:Methyltransferase type 11 n=1 Tax=Mesorhizobium plurifarium TaxID=69974 RepID=A0A090GAI9_MESPL|nr:Methyltransferase type 11 [Mesorhizobium plurifarium]
MVIEVNETAVADHYTVNDLGTLILHALQVSGNANSLSPIDLAPVDEFHMGGRAATQHVIGMMNLPNHAHVLDVGSGLGGVARYLAAECGCRATGIDLTAEYVRVGTMLTERTGLADKVNLHVGSALEMPWPKANFDAAVTFHVAMNIADRPRLYAEVARVIRPGSPFAIYDVLKGPEEGLLFPVPWAETAETSFLVTAGEMRKLLDDAGFDIVHEEDRREIALGHHRERLAAQSAAGGLPPLGLHLLQGPTASLKSRNMVTMLEANQITLAAIVARRRA